MPSPGENLIANLADVYALFALHFKHAGGEPGRRRGVEALNKGAIALTTACWEAFVEDIATIGAEHILSKNIQPGSLPGSIQKKLCDRIRSDSHELAAWRLAGSGWQHAYKQHVAAEVERFHTPRAPQVDGLLDRTIGCLDVSKSWSWRGMSVQSAREKLDALVTLRGDIVHRVAVDKSVYKNIAIDYAQFIQRLAVRTNNVTREHVAKLTGKVPWQTLEFKE